MYVKVKKRKTLFGLWIFLSLLAIVVTPIAVVLGVLYNDNVQNVEKAEPKEAEALFNDIFYETLHEVKDTGKLTFEITEEDINSMLVSAVENFKLDPNVSNLESLVHNFYFVDQEEYYQIGLEVNLYNIYKTRLDIFFNFTWDVDPTHPLDGVFTLEILDLKIGNLSAVDSVLGYIPESVLKEETLQAYFDEINLSIDVDLKGLKLTYRINDMLNDLISMIQPEETSDDLMSTLILEFARYNVISFKFEHDHKIAAEIDLTSFHNNSRLTTHDKDNKDVEAALPNYIALIETLRNHKTDPLPEEHSTLVLRYLIRGYVGCGEADKPVIRSLAPYLARIGISNPETYVPTTYPALELKEDMMGDIFSNFDTEQLLSGQIAKVTEDTLNEVLTSSYIYGYNFLIETTDTDENIYLNYIVLDNFYINVVEGHLYLTMGLNFNGYELTISLLLHIDNDNKPEFGLALFVESIYLGEHRAGDEVINIIYPLLENAFADTGFSTFDETNGVLTIDFEPHLDEAFDSIENLGLVGNFTEFAEISIVLRGMLEDTGYIDVTWHLKK